MTRLDDTIGQPLASRLTLNQVTEVLNAIDQNPDGVYREARDVLNQPGIERPVGLLLARLRRGDHLKPNLHHQTRPPAAPPVTIEQYDGAGVETTAARARDLVDRIKRGDV